MAIWPGRQKTTAKSLANTAFHPGYLFGSGSSGLGGNAT
jgi:hypothetical protein